MTISVYRYSLPATLGDDPASNAIRNAALEEAAKACEAHSALLLKRVQNESRSPMGYENTLRFEAEYLAACIRAMKRGNTP